MKLKRILSLSTIIPIALGVIPLQLTSCGEQQPNKEYVDVTCENEPVVISTDALEKNHDANIYIKSKHNDVFIDKLMSIAIGETPLEEGQYTFGTCEEESGWTHLLHIGAEYITDNVNFNLQLNEEKVITKPNVTVQIVGGGELPDTRIEGKLPDKIYHDTGFETNLIVHNEVNNEDDPIYWWTPIDATVTYGESELSEELWDFDINPQNPLKAHFKLYPLEDIDSNQISIALKVYDTKKTFSGYASDGVTTIDLGEFPSGEGEAKVVPLNRFVPIGSTKVIKAVVLYKYVDDGWYDVQPGPETYSFNEETKEVTFQYDLLNGNQLFLDVILEVNHSTTFENDNWREIGYWSKAPLNRIYEVYKKTPGTFGFIGSIRELNFDGIKQKVRVIAENTDTLTSDPNKKAVWTFEFVNCLEDGNGLVKKSIGSKEDALSKFWQYSKSNFENNRLRTYLNGDEFVNKMEVDVNKIVKSVTKHERVSYYQWDPSSRPYHKFKRTNVDDRYFILTCTDAGGHRRNEDTDDKITRFTHYGAEGIDLGDECTAYSYYNLLSSDIPTDDAISGRVKTDKDGNAQLCWTSTPSIAESEDRYEDRVMCFTTDGSFTNSRINNEYCICPVFCI